MYKSYFRESKIKRFDDFSFSEKKKFLSKIPSNPKDFKIWEKDINKYTTADGEKAKFVPNKYKEGDIMYGGLFPSDDSGFVYQLKYVNPHDITYGETWQKEEDVIAMDSTQQYIEWMKQGYEPIPVVVVYNKRNNTFKSINRRRVIASRVAKVSKIPAFIEIGKYEDLIKEKELTNIV